MTITHRLPSLHLACAVVAMLALHSCIPEPACAGTPLQLRWTAELSDPKPYNAVLFAGESADLQATLKLYGRAVALEDSATASLYWQTNGMASAWWSVPATVTTAGVVTASWTPAMDAGADLYRWHIGVANAASSTVYRAFGAFRMQPSPGATPNVLAPPVRWIDFDLVAISNAPWATPADVAAAVDAIVEADPIAYPVATNALALATSALQPPATNGMLTAEADTLATVTARGATTTEAVTIGTRGAGTVGQRSFAHGDNVIASGFSSHAEGSFTVASGENSHAEGDSTFASGSGSHSEGYGSESSGVYSHSSGFNAASSNMTSFAWQGSAGTFEETHYGSHGPGTFNLNPAGGLAGFWIGEETLDALLGAKATYLAATNIAASAVAGSGHAIAEQVVSGAVCTASAGNRYFWTSATNVVLSVNLTSGQVVNLARLNNTATNSIAAIGQVGWEWTGGDVTNTISAGKSMTFGFLIDAATGKTNAYATGVSK